MDQQPDQRSLPSMLVGGLTGCGIGAVVAAILSPVFVVKSGFYDNVRGFDLIALVSAAGAMLGLEVTARLRKRRDPNTPQDELRQFFNSWKLMPLALAILGLAIVLSTIVAFAHDAIVRLPGSGPG